MPGVINFFLWMMVGGWLIRDHDDPYCHPLFLIGISGFIISAIVALCLILI